MKSLFFIVSFLFIVHSASFAQWAPANATGSTNIYNTNSNGNVGIGTGSTTLGAILHINTSNSRALYFTRGNGAPFGFEIASGIFGLYDYTLAKYMWRASSGNLFLAESGGNVLIGKTSQVNTAYKLDVNGGIRANLVVVNTTGADFVFAKNYQLRPLSEVESFIQANHHLPEIAPASQMQKEGVNVGELQTQLLQKIEELTLYLIEQNKQLQNLSKQLEEVKLENESIKNQIQK
jgi:hypothetical protein